MLQGYRTYLTVIGLAIYNIAFPLLGIKEVSMDAVDTTINTVSLILIAVFRKLAKPK
mgnify:CR=1 FL=1